MSPLFVYALCVIEACLIQSVFSQSCGYPQYNPYGSGIGGLGGGINSQPQPAPVSAPSGASYGGVGTGQVSVSGDIDASGQTVVVGSVPVLGSVDFSGTVPAAGSVSISGQCGCGCS